MRKCGLCCQPVSVCQSVCLSVTFVYCIQTAEDIVNLLSRPGSPLIHVFLPQALLPNSKENAFIGGVKYTGGGKNERFLTENSVYLRNSTR